MIAKSTSFKVLLGALLLLFCNVLFAQKTITGKITDPNSLPVAGATVSVKGTNVASETDVNGNFSISVPNGKNSLVVTSVGFEPQTINVANQSNVSVSLVTSASTLNEVVVTGYTAQRKKEITGAVSVVNVNQLKQTPVGTGEEALQGRASGVTIISSGQPGAASDIRIRGITAFGNNSPLVIIDGVRAGLHDINVNDIESIQVLKDASASIYGIAGSNGVILITTKRGKTGKARVSYDGYYGNTTRGKGFDLASTQEEANAIWLQQRNSGIANPSSKQYGNGATPVIPYYITPTGGALGDPNADPSKYNINSNQITVANQQGTNWYNEITRNAITHSHNVSVSAGSEKSSYFFSLGYLNQQGILRFSELKRYSVRANTQFNINNKIRVGENAYLFYKTNPSFGNQSEGSPFTTALREDAIIPVYDIMGNFAGTKSQDLGNARNPYADIYRTKDNHNNNWDMVGNVYAEVDFLKHFTARTSFGGSVDNNYSYNFGFVGYENAEGNTGANSFGENAGYNSSWTYTNTLAYNNAFGDHSVKFLLGTEAVQFKGRFLSAGRSSFFSEDPNFRILNAGTGPQSNSGGAYQSALSSQFARVEYGYKGKYLVNASIRRDGSSVFADSVRYGYFPAVSAAWRISEENFLKGVSFINDLKIRYSWGKLGSISNVNATNPLNLYGSSAGRSSYDIGGNSTSATAGFYRSTIGNPNTTFEGDIISNVGIDATILKNKLDFSIDWYKKKVSGLLFTASGTQYDRIFTGDVGLPKVNIGDMQNTGIDASASYHGAVARDFKFDITGTFTSYNNKIVSIPGLPFFDGPTIRNVKITRNQVGHAVGSFFGYKVLGLFQDAADVSKSPKQDDASPGVFKYEDVNGDGKINADDRTFIGDPNPDFTYGLNLAFSYKNFDFSTFFFGSKGNDIYNNTLYFTDFPDFFKGAISRRAATNSFTPTNTNTTIPKLRTTGGFSTDLVTNSYFISKGSYLRNKQIQLGYTVPSRSLSRFGIERLRIYVQAANMFTITKYDGLDPELQSQPNNGQINNTSLFGIDQGNYPHTPAYLIGINLNF